MVRPAKPIEQGPPFWLRLITLAVYLTVLMGAGMWFMRAHCTKQPYADSRYGSGIVCQW